MIASDLLKNSYETQLGRFPILVPVLLAHMNELLVDLSAAYQLDQFTCLCQFKFCEVTTAGTSSHPTVASRRPVPIYASEQIVQNHPASILSIE